VGDGALVQRPRSVHRVDVGYCGACESVEEFDRAVAPVSCEVPVSKSPPLNFLLKGSR